MSNSENTPSASLVYSKQYPEFTTVTWLEWKRLLNNDEMKDIITNSLSFLQMNQRAIIYAFVIMDNHFHMIWQIAGDHKREDVQRDFLKFTGQQILKTLRNENSTLYDELVVNAQDRKRQVWERNSLGVSLWSCDVICQKVSYIHNNPVKAGFCNYASDYKYSSAGFYMTGDKRWDFLTHIDGVMSMAMGRISLLVKNTNKSPGA